jgi:hypothetical protein
MFWKQIHFGQDFLNADLTRTRRIVQNPLEILANRSKICENLIVVDVSKVDGIREKNVVPCTVG